MFKGLFVIIGALLTVGLTACDTAALMTKADTEGLPPVYKRGYQDGCNSGYAAAGSLFSGKHAKDVNAYLGDKQYKVGWDDGFARCKGSYEGARQDLK